MKSATVVKLPRPIAVYPVCNHGGYEILRYDCVAGEERVRVATNNGESRQDHGYRKISYTATGRAFFKMFGLRLYLDQFIKI